MTENKQYILTFETVVEAEDLYEAVTIGSKLGKKYKEDELDLKGVMIREKNTYESKRNC